MNDQNKLTRRQVVAGLGTTLAAVAVSPGFASGHLPTLKAHLAAITAIDKQMNSK